MSHVFLSYSRKNSETAFRVYNRLQSTGMPAWIDQRSIRPGASYAEEIFLAINSASAVVLLLSSASNESKEIHKEVGIAASGNIPIIPLRLEPVTYHPALGYHLAALQWIDATDDLEWALATLQEQLGRLLLVSSSITESLVAESPVTTSAPPTAVPSSPEVGTTVSGVNPMPAPSVRPTGIPSDGDSLQQQLAAAILAAHPDGVVEKIDQDHFLDIFLPSVSPRRTTNLTFKTQRGVIRAYFYCRSAEFVDQVIRSATHVERWHWGLMPIGDPAFTNADDAIRSALQMLADIVAATGSTRSTDLLPERPLSTEPTRTGPTRQDELAAAILREFPDAVVKKINTDDWFYIHLPSVNSQWMTHLMFNTAKGQIRFNFYVKDSAFIAAALSGGVELEATGSVVRLAGDPRFPTAEEATSAAVHFIRLLESRCQRGTP